MTWYARFIKHFQPLRFQYKALRAAITTFRASFNSAATEAVGTPFLLSTSETCAWIRELELDVAKLKFPVFVALLASNPAVWQVAIFGNTSTNSLTVEATDARAALKT
jgi:hypothetical protein